MNTSKHTPGPWIAERGGTISAAGHVVATCGMGMQHNAAHIVRCVNERDGLLAALRDIAADRACYAPELQAIARAALAKAGAA